MIFWLTRRIIESLVIVTMMAMVIYALISLMPGDPIDLMVFGDPHLTADDAARLKSLLGLDRPWQERFWEWAKRALAGEFGYSRLFGQPVLQLLTDYLANTALLMGCSFLLSLLVGGYIGILAATRPGTGLDSGINFMFFLGVSVPAFWMALVLILVFAVELSWLPSGGVGRGDWQDRIEHAILPIISLSIPLSAYFGRFTRAEMLQTLRTEYVLAAYAHGLPPRRVLYAHAMRNASLPIVTVTGLQIGQIFSGALITEVMFSYPGMGKLMFDAILGNDYNLALVGLLLATVMTLGGNMCADLLYMWLDPRIKLTAGNAQR